MPQHGLPAVVNPLFTPQPGHTRPSRQMSLADQISRTRELDAVRLQRRLTPGEQAEADNLADRAYQRQWRALQRRNEAIIAVRQIAPGRRTDGHRNAGGGA